ncbi:Inositolphosphorylceramide-B hydroxylase [Dothidotthia symphoricarpi CBS 119687]|uniref:Ceramide very long chain fatty acid hydroxylase n=1 Tax=Dothidotthia symphoricarpi CBS 119687 TaxID=1392245 RepID=A0A6A6A1N8_9PLEO|nr:Inositolphosphorylceramide-B hydroxylase [Dothidotthia symphoricarpi CBS 119687]KAF2124867.1 Inositolphosphorylceramide-B hydroxylase [Dothidotthia symphoricarpi CBS 119687]
MSTTVTMPGRTLPTIPAAEVQAHNNEKSCYVTIGTKVYDVTDFLSDHPGGEEYILEYGGKDVTEILKDEISHTHSDSAYEMLDEYLVGFMPTEAIINGATKSSKPGEIVPLLPSEAGKAELMGMTLNGTPLYAATGMSSAEDLSRETDANVDYRQHKFLDLSRPLFMQVWNGGFDKDFYLEQVHRPRHYRGGDSAPLFGNFLEPLSKTPWWMVPTIWWPCAAFGTVLAAQHLTTAGLVASWMFGLGFWTIVEYVLHRFLFHLDAHLPNNRVAITLHFLLHGIHHYLPMDKYRLVMPPTLFIVLAIPFWKLAHIVVPYDWYAATAVFCGGIFGYTCYDMTHYFLHHQKLPAYWQELKKYHLAHHFADYENGFGVTSRFWDWVFGTELASSPSAPKVIKSS